MYDAMSARLLLGCFIIKPPLILEDKYKLTKDDFVRILTEPKNAIIKQYIKLFKPYWDKTFKVKKSGKINEKKMDI